MEQDPKKINPVITENKTYPGQDLSTNAAEPSFVDMLPSIFRTETNNKVLGSVVEDMFQPAKLETLNFAVGKHTSKAVIADYLPHPLAKRQLEPGLVVYNPAGVHTLSADELALAWNFNDRANESAVPISILDLPIDPDKFVNYGQYHWVEEGLPPILLRGSKTETFSVNDIIGKPYYTTIVQSNGKRLELKNGMRVAFLNSDQLHIDGDVNIEFTTTGNQLETLDYDFTLYNKDKIGVSINGVLKDHYTDYTIVGNQLYWINVPPPGGHVYIHLPDYYVNTTTDIAFRQFQIDGVGSKNGIRLLGRTHQNTRTAYSRASDSLWDQTAITWDQIEWDGLIPGINAKHYVLQKVGAENRNANSRINVWYHVSTIQEIVDYLDVPFDDIATKNSTALRPIIEFENTLELFNHGTKYRSWVVAVEQVQANPAHYLNKTIAETNIELGIASTATKDNSLNYSPRVLWLTAGPYKNKIITFESINGIFTKFYAELPNNGDTVTVNDTTMAEYHWKNGIAKISSYRKSITQLPSFELYSKDCVRLSDYLSVFNIRPNIISSNIIKFPLNGNILDKESGFKIKFLPSHYSRLSEGNIAKDAMYDIIYQHTQHDYSYYIETGTSSEKTVPGPYSFRRITGDTLANELSNGYRRAWFRLKSNASRLVKTIGLTTIPLDATMWPTYNWGLTIEDDLLKVIHTDNYEIVVNNCAVVARNETATFNLFVPGHATTATVSGFGISDFNAEITENTLQFIVPNNAPSFLKITIGNFEFTANVIDALNDPRNFSVKLNGLPVDYQTTVTRNSNNVVTALSIAVNATGAIEINHQGDQIENDHISAIPGLALNPEQVANLGEFSMSRIVNGIDAQLKINATGANGQTWVSGPQFLAMDGIRMADHSAMRAAWAGLKLTPSLNDITISRSSAAWRWHRKFLAKLQQHIDMLDLEHIPLRNAVDRLLEELLLGITYSSADAVSGMAFTTTGMNSASYVGDNTTYSFKINTGADSLYQDVYGPDHVYVYVNESLLLSTHYTVNSDATVTLNFVPALNDTILIYHASEASVYSGIPASPAKLGLSGIFEPRIVTETWGTNSRKFIRRHDGSLLSIFKSPDVTVNDEDFYPNLIVLEIENRIYNGCPNRVGDINKQGQVLNYSDRNALETQGRAQLEWYSINQLDYRDRTNDFVASDPWTWNYGGYSWRGLYKKTFGTYNIHSSPWESLGYDDAPIWWNEWYSWTDTGKRSNLEYALQQGIVSEPYTPIVVNPEMIRASATFPVGLNGELLDPTEWGIPSPTADEAQQPWEIGSYGPAEVAWHRSVAGTWNSLMYALDDYNVFSKFFDSAVNPYIRHVENYSVAPKGYNSFSPSQFYQDRPTVGIGSIIFEANREFNLVGEDPLNELMSLNPRLQFAMGGYTDGNITLTMYHVKFQTGNYVPKEDFYVTLTDGVSVEQVRYSAVRIEKDDVGFRVYGFDPKNRFFTVFKPVARALTTSYPQSRTTFSTPHGDFIEYLAWDPAEVKVQYGSYIANKQDLITFLMGLGEYQKSRGLLLDQLNSRGTINDWRQASIDALAWSDENWGTKHYCVVGPIGNNGLEFAHEFGTLDRLDADVGRIGKIMFSSGRSALASELLITRNIRPGVDKIIPTVNEQIVFADLRLRQYDHVVYINKKTKFNDLISDLQTGQRLDVLEMFARRTFGWTGRPGATGVLTQRNSILPGFDSLASDIIDSHRPELQAFDLFKTTLARSNVVPLQSSIIFDIIHDNTTAHLFRQGLQYSAGTNLAMNALFRNKNLDIPGRVQDIAVNEQWSFNTGNFGRLDSQRIWEIELLKEDFTSNRQIIRFNINPMIDFKDLQGDNIIDLVGNDDPRWITRPIGSTNFPIIPRSTVTVEYARANGWLPSAGIANLIDTDIKAVQFGDVQLSDFQSLSDIPVTADTTSADYTLTPSKLFTIQSYSRYADYNVGDYSWYQANLYRALTKIVGSDTNAFDSTHWIVVPVTADLLPTIWVSDYSDGKGWNVLQTLAPSYIEEICPNFANQSLNESKVTFASPHNLKKGEFIIVTGSGDYNYDNIHAIKEVVDDYNVLIAARSTSGKIVYDLLAFRIHSVKFDTDAQWHQAEAEMLFLPGMKAYIDYGDPEGTYKIITYITDGSGQTATSTKFSGPMVDTSIIYKSLLIDYDTEETLITLDVFDPYKGLTIDAVAKWLDYKGIIDPAVYNITELNQVDPYAVESWSGDKVGKLWWDLSQVRYIEYEQSDDIQYRAAHWGEKFANTSVAVYEWSFAFEEPTVLTVQDARLDYSSGQAQIRYSQRDEIDPVTKLLVTKYYYWKRGATVVPPGIVRDISCGAIESILNDPDENKVAWLSPISNSALIVANMDTFFGANDKMILRIEESRTPYQMHTTDMLVIEGFEGDTIDDYLYRRLEASITGRDNYRETYSIREYLPAVNDITGTVFRIDNIAGVLSNSNEIYFTAADTEMLEALAPGMQLIKVSGSGNFGPTAIIKDIIINGRATQELSDLLCSCDINLLPGDNIYKIILTEDYDTPGRIVFDIKDYVFNSYVIKDVDPEVLAMLRPGMDLIRIANVGKIGGGTKVKRVFDNLIVLDLLPATNPVLGPITFNASMKYFKGDTIMVINNGIEIQSSEYSAVSGDYPVLRNLDDSREDIIIVWRSKNGADNKIYIVHTDFVGSTFDYDKVRHGQTINMIRSPACAIIKDLFPTDSNQFYALINTRRKVPDVKLHPLRRYGNGYVPYPQSWFKDLIEARRTLIVAANDFLLKIDVVSRENFAKYITTYYPLNGIYSKDLTPYWEYVDYVAEGYNYGREQYRLESNLEISSLPSSVTNFAIVDSADNTIEAYNKVDDTITLVYRKNGTIQFKKACWDGSLGDAWDRTNWDRLPWDEDASELFESILKALRKSIFIDNELGYFNLLFFALVKESLKQVPTADWVFKTTYLDIAQTSNNDLKPAAIFYNKKDALIKDYLDEVKPYHSQIIDTNQFVKSLEPITVSVAESVELTITTLQILTTENEQILSTGTGAGLTSKEEVATITLVGQG